MSHWLDIVLHINLYLAEWIQIWGLWIYALLFAIIFAETGLVVMPFLPGDSLLFAIGALTTLENGLDMTSVLILLSIAAILGDWTNYQIGSKLGKKMTSENSFFRVKPAHIKKTEEFYDKHGAKSIVLARFAPIVRTFVPFVAGVGKMDPKIFFKYNIIGGILWIQSFVWLGYFFGNMPQVQKNFSLIIFAIIFLSLVPIGIEIFKAKMKIQKVK